MRALVVTDRQLVVAGALLLAVAGAVLVSFGQHGHGGVR
jgi:hypothetical protein